MRCYRWLENRKGKHKEDKEMQTHTNTLKKKKKKETWHTKRSDLTEDDKLKHVSQKILNQMSQQRDHTESTGPQIRRSTNVIFAAESQ